MVVRVILFKHDDENSYVTGDHDSVLPALDVVRIPHDEWLEFQLQVFEFLGCHKVVTTRFFGADVEQVHFALVINKVNLTF